MLPYRNRKPRDTYHRVKVATSGHTQRVAPRPSAPLHSAGTGERQSKGKGDKYRTKVRDRAKSRNARPPTKPHATNLLDFVFCLLS